MGSKTRSFGLWFLLSLPLLFNQGCGGSGPVEVLASPTPSPDTSAKLLWEPPTSELDGSPLTDLAGYRVYISQTMPLTKTASPWVAVDSATTYTFTGLSPGVYYFAVTAMDLFGNESAFSNEASKAIL